MASFQLGFYTVLILAILKIILVLLEIILAKPWRTDCIPNKKMRDRRKNIRQWFAGAMAFFAIVLGGVTFVVFRNDRPSNNSSCRNADADIVGDGIRTATWIQEGILFVIAFYGLFLDDKGKTGAKEFGAGLVLIHMSLSAALMVSFGRGQLSSVDAMLGSMILDAQSNSLSVQLATKETLAARWQVASVISAQLTGLVVLGILIGSFSHGSFLTEDCGCFVVFWWSWFSDCSTTVPNQVFPLWIYYCLRWLAFIHCSFISIRLAPRFDKAERSGRSCAECRQRDQLSPTQAPPTQAPPTQAPPTQAPPTQAPPTQAPPTQVGGGGLRDESDWSEIPATHTLMFLEYSVFALLSMCSAEVLMAVHHIQKSSPVHSIGQVTALVVAGGTTVRAVWVFIFQFVGEEKKKKHE
jgi:hypothetical protein